MRKLERGANAPGWLAQRQHDTHPWSPTNPEKDAIWAELDRMQGGRCAYCEADISTQKSRHIEHFAARARHKELTFAWDNLFGSCVRRESCGTYKDGTQAAPYDWTELIKPDVHNPDQYLLFVADGTIVPLPGLSEADLKRAKETLRVFNLDAEWGELRKEREKAIKAEKDAYEEIFAIWQAAPDVLDLDEAMSAFFAEVEKRPFCTAIRHVLRQSRHQGNPAWQPDQLRQLCPPNSEYSPQSGWHQPGMHHHETTQTAALQTALAARARHRYAGRVTSSADSPDGQTENSRHGQKSRASGFPTIDCS